MSNVILEKLNAELEIAPMGNNRKFKFVHQHLDSEEKTINFFIKVLGYKKHQAKKIAYDIKYEQKRYRQQKLNSCQ